MNTAKQHYDEFFTDSGELLIGKAASCIDGSQATIVKVDWELASDIRFGKFTTWNDAQLPNWFLPFRPLTDWEYWALTQGRMHGMKDAHILRSASTSVPMLSAWLSAGQDMMLEGGQALGSGLELELFKLWDTAHYRSRLAALEKIAKNNPESYLRRTSKDGTWDDKEVLRQMEYKAELARKEQERDSTTQIKFDF